MKLVLPALAAVLALSGVGGLALSVVEGQDSNFESAEYGIRLKIPAGWNIDATRERVVLKITLPGEFLIKPEIRIYEVPLGEPLTVGQYKEPYRQFLQKSLKEPRLTDDQDIKVGGKPGFVLTVQTQESAELEQVQLKGIWVLSPKRMLAADALFPKAQAEAMAKTYTAMLSTIEFLPRKELGGVADAFKLFSQSWAKVPAVPEKLAQDEELEVVFGDKPIGTYSISFRPGVRNEKPGMEFRALTRIDLGAEGKVETLASGFLSSDLSSQVVDISELKTGKDKRTQNVSAHSVLAAGEAQVDRCINGEKSTFKRAVPEKCVLSELSEMVQTRLLEVGKGVMAFPVLAAFDDDVTWMKIELAGINQMKVGDRIVDVYVTFLMREDASLMTYWYDGDRKLSRITTSGQSVVVRRKK